MTPYRTEWILSLGNILENVLEAWYISVFGNFSIVAMVDDSLNNSGDSCVVIAEGYDIGGKIGGLGNMYFHSSWSSSWLIYLRSSFVVDDP